MLVWIENTSLALWVSTSLWAYPFLLSIHITGLAIIVGIFAIRDFHLVGVVSGLSVSNFLELKRLAYCGFMINSLSGIMLFSSQASYLATNLPFLLKIFFIGSGMILASQIHKTIEEKKGHAGLKKLAILSLTCWCGAIVAGRLIAYIF